MGLASDSRAAAAHQHDRVGADMREILPDPTADDWADDGTFRIADDRLASWALRKIALASKERDRLKDNTADEINGLRDALAADLRPLDRTVEFMVDRLERYRLDLEAKNPDLAKTYKLPCGSLARRKAPPRVEVYDEDQFIAWALDNEPMLVIVSPRKSEIKAAVRRTDDGAVVVTETGQVVPGVVLGGGEETIKVTASIPLGSPF